MKKSTGDLLKSLKSSRDYAEFLKKEIGELQFVTLSEYLDLPTMSLYPDSGGSGYSPFAPYRYGAADPCRRIDSVFSRAESYNTPLPEWSDYAPRRGGLCTPSVPKERP